MVGLRLRGDSRGFNKVKLYIFASLTATVSPEFINILLYAESVYNIALCIYEMKVCCMSIFYNEHKFMFIPMGNDGHERQYY